MKSDQDNWDNEGGHMSSTGGRIGLFRGAERPYVVTLTHHASDATEHAFPSMREAEDFIKRNTPVPGALLATTYDRPAAIAEAPETCGDSVLNDDDILLRLKVINQRLRQISADDAASVLAAGLANARIHEQERLRVIAESERILDEMDGKNHA